MKIQTAITFRSSKTDSENIPYLKVRINPEETLKQKETQVKETLAQNFPEDSYDVFQRDWTYDKSVILRRKVPNPASYEIWKELAVSTPTKRHQKAQKLKAQGVTPTNAFVLKILHDEGFNAKMDALPNKRGIDIFPEKTTQTSED